MKTLIIYNKEGTIVNKVPTEENELFNILCDIPDNKTIKSINIKKKKPVFEDNAEVKTEKDKVLNNLDKISEYITVLNRELDSYKKRQLYLENEYVKMVINSLQSIGRNT